jgi:tetratricopeptide (TPR) repeat protein
MGKPFSCFLVLLALTLVVPALAGDEAHSPARAIDLLNQGNVEEAERMLRELLRRDPADLQVRVLLGRTLDYDGRPEEAARTWREGLKGEAADFALWMHIGTVHARLGREGPTVQYKRGVTTYTRNADPAAAERIMRAHRVLAREAFDKAAALAPGRHEPQLELAILYDALKEHEAAIAAWRGLAARDPENAAYATALARALNEAGRPDQAAAVLEAALKRNPRLSEAHAMLATYYHAAGRRAEAWQSRQQAEFYRRLPPFTRLLFSPQALQALERLNDRDGVSKLVEDPSDEAAQLLAVIAWRHPHDELETMAFESLERRGAAAVGVVRDLLEGARSARTVRASAAILARHKDPGLFEKIVGALPRDLGSAEFEMDIAGALDALGDPRAVPPLVQVFNPGDRSPSRRDSAIYDRTRARARAALALGGFDAPAAKEALAQGLDHPELAPYAAAALYRQSGGDARYVPALREVAAGNDRYALSLLAGYLRKVPTPDALQLTDELGLRLRELGQWP